MNGAHIAPIVAAAVVRARRKMIDRLAEAGAVTEATAVAVEPKRRMERKALEYLCHEGIVAEPQPGRYFVRRDRAELWHRRLHRRAFIAAVAAVAILAAVLSVALWFARG